MHFYSSLSNYNVCGTLIQITVSLFHIILNVTQQIKRLCFCSGHSEIPQDISIYSNLFVIYFLCQVTRV